MQYLINSFSSIICIPKILLFVPFKTFFYFLFEIQMKIVENSHEGISICFDPHFLFLFQFENIPTEKSNKFVIPFGIVLETKVDWIAIVVILLIELLLYIYVQILIAPNILQTTFYSQLVFSKYRK